MSISLVGPTTGLERCAREFLLICASSLNAEIAAQEAAWGADDEQLAVALAQTYQTMDLEPIDTANYYLGHRPSLLKGDLSRYPNLSVFGGRSRPGDDNDLDAYFGIELTLRIEIMVKAGPYPDDPRTGLGEDLVNARIQRTTDAVYMLVNRNGTLNGLVPSGLKTPPDVRISDVFVKMADSSLADSPIYFLQASTMEYNFNRITSLQ